MLAARTKTVRAAALVATSALAHTESHIQTHFFFSTLEDFQTTGLTYAFRMFPGSKNELKTQISISHAGAHGDK